MKTKQLKINQPCIENWENMNPNNDGRFCKICSKTVIDFTKLSSFEINERIKSSNGKLCAKLTKKQLQEPLIDVRNNYEYNFPYPKKVVAASLIITTSISSCQQTETKNEPIEIYASLDNNQAENIEIQNQEIAIKEKSNSEQIFKGRVVSRINNESVKNAKITFVSVQKIISAYTQKDGSFTMFIPKELIDQDNVIRVSYYEIDESEKEKDNFYGYEIEDYILSKNDMETEYSIKATPVQLIMGGIGAYSEEVNPVVIENGNEIKYKDFAKALNGKKSSCSLENKDYLFFEPRFAIAIYGKKAKDGLYILTNKTEN